MTVPDSAAGQFGTCRKCGTRLRVPTPDPEPEIDFGDAPVPSRPRSMQTPTQVKAAVSAPPAKTLKQQYAETPFYRRNGLVSFLMLLGLFIGLTLVPACIIVATGDVYRPALGDDGKLQKWSPANRYIAIFLLFAWAAALVYIKRS